jgi:hypothetical protein
MSLLPLGGGRASSCFVEQSDHQQKNNGTDDGIYDGREKAANKNEPERKQPTRDHPAMPTKMLPSRPRP